MSTEDRIRELQERNDRLISQRDQDLETIQQLARVSDICLDNNLEVDKDIRFYKKRWFMMGSLLGFIVGVGFCVSVYFMAIHPCT